MDRQREAPILQAIKNHIGANPDYRLFRMNVGKAQDPKTGRVVAFGIPGMADLTGIRRTTCPHCGAPGPGQRVEIETKAPDGRLRPEQIIWRDAMLRMGAAWLAPRSLEEACELLGLPLPR